MEYDRGDSFSFNLNEMQFRSVHNQKENYVTAIIIR